MKTEGGLTQGYADETARQIAATRPGQAHFAFSGPPNASCAECRCYGYEYLLINQSGNVVGNARRRGACEQYFKLLGQHGPSFPGNTPSCRHFMPKG
jgi:hypothetical protein